MWAKGLPRYHYEWILNDCLCLYHCVRLLLLLHLPDASAVLRGKAAREEERHDADPQWWQYYPTLVWETAAGFVRHWDDVLSDPFKLLVAGSALLFWPVGTLFCNKSVYQCACVGG